MKESSPNVSKELIQEATDCLREKEREVDDLVDVCRGDYQAARSCILMKYLKIADKEARALLEQVDKEVLESIQKVAEVKSLVSEIQEDTRDLLVEQLIFAYECFCQKHGLSKNEPIPEKFKQTTILEFPEIGEKTQCVPLYLAHFFLKPCRIKACKELFRYAAGESTLTT